MFYISLQLEGTGGNSLEKNSKSVNYPNLVIKHHKCTIQYSTDQAVECRMILGFNQFQNDGLELMRFQKIMKNTQILLKN